MTTTTHPHISWIMFRDMPQVMAIEQASFEYPWTEDELLTCMRQSNTIGMSARQGDKVLGYVIYELCHHRIYLLNLAVHPQYRRQAVASTLISKLKAKLHPDRRTSIRCKVRESNLPAQLFLRSCGFLCVDTLRSAYQENDDDAYFFQYEVG
jgi:ribosomal-protein-alanine N-acetyltransferase